MSVQPKLTTAKDRPGPFDVILLSVKAYSLAAAIDDFAPYVGPETMILPMLNGVRHIETLTARFGEQAVLGGSTQISTDVDADGRIHRLTELEDFVYGERDGRVTPRVQTLQEAVQGAGFSDHLSEDVTAFLWEKWVVLAALASLSCLFRSTIGEIASVPRGLAIANSMLEETAAVARAEGHAATEKFLAVARRRLTDPRSSLTASIFRDVQRGAQVEVEHVIGDMLTRAEAHGLETPYLRAAYVHLAAYQARVLRG